MNSEFTTVALDRIRYSLVWEDSRTLYQALSITPADHVLVITSAGCNVLNALLQQPRRVTAIDLNPVQNELLRFKCHLIAHFPPQVLRGLMGFDGPHYVAVAWQEAAATLPTEMVQYWQPFFESHPGGLLTAGRLESYVTGFLPLLEEGIQAKVRRLLDFETVEAQHAFFLAELDNTPFQEHFTAYFDEANLSRGRDASLFKYAAESGGEAFYRRLKETISTKLVRDNFFFRFFFFGPEGLPENLLPPCYQRHNQPLLRRQLGKLTVVTGEATSYLQQPEGLGITKASLSNIFEYTSPDEFRQVAQRLFPPAGRPLRLVYWNLLQNQSESTRIRLPLNTALSEHLSRQDACFYFRNVRVLDSALVSPPSSSTSSRSLAPPPMSASDYISPAFLEQMMQAHAPSTTIRVKSVAPLALDNSASILVALTAGCTEKPIGHFGLAVTLEVNGETQVQHLVLKVKPNGREISGMLASLAQACGGSLAEVYPKYAALTGFEHTHQRELDIYQQYPSGLTPKIWGTYANEEEQVYCVLMEYLEEVTLLNSVMAPETWTDQHIRTTLEQMAAWHARHLVAQPPQPTGTWNDLHSLAYMRQLTPLWEALLDNAASHFPELYPTSRVQEVHTAIEQIPVYWSVLEGMEKTLIHNDLNPRNTCFKTRGEELQLCAYDWELATYHVPQYDVVELLCFVLDEDRYHLRNGYLEHYRQALHQLTGRYADAAEFRVGAGYAALDFGLHRLGMYLMAHTVSPYPFLPRVVNSYFDTLAQLQPLAQQVLAV